MKRLKRILVIAVMIGTALPCFAANSWQQASKSPAQSQQDKEILQACREALIELRAKREIESELRKQVDELKSVNSNQAEQVRRLESAIAKYEQAITARQQAEVIVEALRQNYESQIKVVEKLLENERRKTLFWKMATILALVIGAALGRNSGN